MSENDRNDFSRRADAESARAAQATDTEVAAIHAQLAAAYRDRLDRSGRTTTVSRPSRAGRSAPAGRR